MQGAEPLVFVAVDPTAVSRVIRTSVDTSDMTPEKTVLNYKKLADVERAFRTLKGVDLHVRPIRHRLENRS